MELTVIIVQDTLTLESVSESRASVSTGRVLVGAMPSKLEGIGLYP